MSSSSSRKCISVSLDEIREATNGFDKQKVLGRGGEGTVYSADLRIGEEKSLVAVKNLRPESKEFEKELETMQKIHHTNIVSLLGFCEESSHKILLYEYMQKGSLAKYVTGKNPLYMSWEQRLDVCLGAARGLQYLHRSTDEFPKGIIHRGVKASDILMDENWVGKISDFGLFKLSQADQTKSEMNTNIKGTMGYCAPEYLRFHRITRKIDVYSFGVVLFEVLCLKKPWDREESFYMTDDEDLGQWAQQNIHSQIVEEISRDCLVIFCDIINRSLKQNPNMRPTMDEVVLDLEKALKCQHLADEATSSGISVSLDEIRKATNGFDEQNIIGRGGEGIVYRAYLRIGEEESVVAVKNLNSNSKDFEKELETMQKIHHENIVSLLGFCNQSAHKILIYEYMGKGSLSKYVKGKNALYLSWKHRLNICLGAARGLMHLHRSTDEFPKGIIHRDVKPDNILINENWDGKISDYGMFKLSHAGQMNSEINTGVKGTMGYYAPEYLRFSRVTRKVDVYAFGVVLFEVLCLKKYWDRGEESYYQIQDEDLGQWAEQNIHSQIAREISDDCLLILCDIISRSLKQNPDKRPYMDEVVSDLEKALVKQNAADDISRSILSSQNMRSSTNEWFLPPENALNDQDLANEAARFLQKEELEYQLLAAQAISSGISLTFDEIREATNGFDEQKILGEGGEGTVYSAYLSIGQQKSLVAVKNLKPKCKRFIEEIMAMKNIQHQNIVSFLGFFKQSPHRILIYEYMEKGSLSDYVKGQDTLPMSWKQRLKVCLGAAHGLMYLHTPTNDLPKGIIHRDVKPANILINQDWVGKISDFGFVRRSHPGQTKSLIKTEGGGTRGYCAPEYFFFGRMTRKIDVYSFGVVLFEVLCAKRPWDREEEYNDDEDQGLWALKNIHSQIVDEISNDCLKIICDIISRSLKRKPEDRPSMEEVVLELEEALEIQKHADEATS